MLFYASIPLGILILGLLSRWFERSSAIANQLLQTITICLFLSIIMGFRSTSVGTDTSHYVDAFYQIQFVPLVSWSQTHYEFLYVVFNKLIQLFTDDCRYLFLLESIATVSLFGRFFYRNSPNVLVSFLVFYFGYFYLSAFNISRFWLAVSIALCGYDYIRTGRLLPAIIWAILGGLFHTSVFFFIFIYVLMGKVKIKNDSSILLILFGAVALSFFANQLLALFAALFPRYAVYINNDIGASSGWVFPLMLSCIVIGGLLVTEIEEVDFEMEYVRELSLLVVFGVMLLLMGGISDVAARGAQLFTIFLTLLIPKVARITRYEGFYTLCCLACLSAYCLILLASNSGEIIPYIFLSI